MVVDDVENDTDPERVRFVNEAADVVRPPVKSGRRETQHAVVTPAEPSGELGDWKDLDDRDAQTGERGQLAEGGCERAFGGERADMHLVDDRRRLAAHQLRELEDARNLRYELPAWATASLGFLPDSEQYLDPIGTVIFAQNAVPLDLEMERFGGGTPPDSERRRIPRGAKSRTARNPEKREIPRSAKSRTAEPAKATNGGGRNPSAPVSPSVVRPPGFRALRDFAPSGIRRRPGFSAFVVPAFF